MATRFMQSGVAVLLAALCCVGASVAADVDDLPPLVRMMLEGVEVDWEGLTIAAPEPVTLGPRQPEPLPGSTASPTVAPGLTPLPAPQSPGAVSLDRKPIDLGASGSGKTAVSSTTPAAVPGPHLAGNAPVTLGAADLLPEVVAASALSAARRDALVALAGAGALSAEEWKDKILRERLTFDDLCAIWQQFRRDYPQQGESPEHTRRLWHGARDALGLAEVDIAALPTPQLFVLAEMQLYPGETQGAEKCLRALLAPLESGEPPGPRVTRGLLAYRIAQCYKHRGETEKAIEWFRSCAEWGAPTKDNSYDVRGEGLVEAARLLRQVGRTEEAEAAYRRAIASTAGWGKAVATLDLSAALRSSGDARGSETLLTEIADGSCGPVAQGHALLRLARQRFEAGDGDGTRKWLRRVAQVAVAGDPQTLSAAETAEAMLAELARWEREPVRAYPQTLRLTPGRDAAEVLVWAWRETPSVRAGAGWLAVEPLATPQRREGLRYQRYRIALRGECPEGTTKADILVDSGNGDADPLLHLAVTAVKEPSVLVTPQEFFFGFVRSGEELRREVIVMLPRPFVVRAARSDRDASRVGDPEMTDQGWRITASVVGAEPSVLRGTITVLTDMPGRQEIRIPLYAHVSGG